MKLVDLHCNLSLLQTWYCETDCFHLHLIIRFIFYLKVIMNRWRIWRNFSTWNPLAGRKWCFQSKNSKFFLFSLVTKCLIRLLWNSVSLKIYHSFTIRADGKFSFSYSFVSSIQLISQSAWNSCSILHRGFEKSFLGVNNFIITACDLVKTFQMNTFLNFVP
jgi:hypothetical protein